VVASHVGSWILVIAVTVLVADIIVMVIYTFRNGKTDAPKGKVITEKRSLSSMSLGIPP
jgi:heme/copper-type cytochrome/quinol oxidase subunit 2